MGTMGVNAGYKWCKRGMNVRCRWGVKSNAGVMRVSQGSIKGVIRVLVWCNKVSDGVSGW